MRLLPRRQSSGTPESESDKAKRDEARATRTARWAAGIVLIVGTTVILFPLWSHVGTVFRDDPFEAREVVETVVKTDASGKTTTETTTKEADQSLVERALANGGLLL